MKRIVFALSALIAISTVAARSPAPTGGPAWLIDLVNGDGGTASAPAPSSVAAVAGYPHITVPAGYLRGVPVGISFIGRAWSEPDAHQARVRLRARDHASPCAGGRPDPLITFSARRA